MSLPIEIALTLLEAHPYVLLFPLVLLEGPIATIAAGLLVAAGLIGWPVAYAVAVTADLTGDTLYYLLGRSARHPRVGRLLAHLGLTWEKLSAMDASFGRNEGKALVGAKVADFAAVPVFVAAGLTPFEARSASADGISWLSAPKGSSNRRGRNRQINEEGRNEQMNEEVQATPYAVNVEEGPAYWQVGILWVVLATAEQTGGQLLPLVGAVSEGFRRHPPLPRPGRAVLRHRRRDHLPGER